ncbi:hypothetical protein [Rhizobium lentis]|uniref:Uncharacterized protein n=1 Tax=Rhizobium lentis TaxID=1138194 RepID=A0A7W8XK33_9HYPH|nr:hypothetical protein [Rhizobium lentis]MBB4577223.1 hypothetical protein [Rhizobium lentis]MBB5553786.1 hypothetical protein [Rhizobium lentis]MBB5564347.1 hypothetical protein [Rhizobium lentis]MBB5570853.1 hypothetical protein [Rhizobium lentis]
MAQSKNDSSADQDRAKGAVKLETLNFKVPVEFKKEFKGYAVAQGVTMLELLREGFELSKAKREP